MVELKEGCNHMTWYVHLVELEIAMVISNQTQPLWCPVLHEVWIEMESLRLSPVQLLFQ